MDDRKLAVAGPWRLVLIDPSSKSHPATRRVLATIGTFGGRVVETRTWTGPDSDRFGGVDLVVVDLTGALTTPIELLLDTVTMAPHVPVLAIVCEDDPDLASRSLVAGAHAVVRARADERAFASAVASGVRDLLTVSRPPLGARRPSSGQLARANPEVFGTLVHRYAQEVQARVDLRRGVATEGLKGPRRDSLAAISSVLAELEAGPRDLADVHIVALRSLCRDTSATAQRQVVHHARQALVETMGRLAGRYRSKAIYSRSESGEADDGALA